MRPLTQSRRGTFRAAMAASSIWAPLPYEEWHATRDTLHMYAQIVGKLRLALSPPEPHWAHVVLYVTSRGLGTSPIPAGSRTFDAELDLLSHELVLRTSDGAVRRRALGGDVADFHRDVMQLLGALDITAKFSELPSEVTDPIPFSEDHKHGTYVKEHAEAFFRVLSMVDVELKRHRARFNGRTSPVQFYWGSFDLALTRFSSRSAEQINAGWWPGDERIPYPAFYAYGSPKPVGIEEAPVEPKGARWDATAGEFLMPYDEVRSTPDPALSIRRFCETTYAGAARLMGWDPALIPS